VDHEEHQHRGRHRRPDDDEEQARETAEAIKADLPPTELSIEEEAARAAREDR